MKEKLSELVFILDKSGSMSGKEEDTVGSFNSTIKEHKDKEYDVLVTSVLFSDNQTIIHDRVNINEIEPMKVEQFVTNGCTALMDAVGDTIKNIKYIQSHQRRKEDIPEHTLFVIITDGMENASHKYSSGDIKKMIEAQKEEGWEFLFLGANIDAVETTKTYGIDEHFSANYINDDVGIKKANSFASKVAGKMFNLGKGLTIEPCCMDALKEELDEDYNTRSNKK